MRLRGPLTRASVVTIVALLVLGTAAAGVPGNVTGHVAAQAPDDPTPIASCTTITEPGEYVLTQDLAANGSADACIRIDVIGTVVIDGQGHSVEGGIDAENDSADETDVTLALELRNATVDTISYPPDDVTGGGGASGLLENVTVDTIEMSNADGLTVESSRVENDIEGWYAGDVTLRNSTFEGRMVFYEDTVRFEIVNNTFGAEVIFFERLANSHIAENDFQSSLEIFDAGITSEDVVIENNRITVDADEANGLEAGGIVFVDVADSVVRNNTIVVERDGGTTATEANGIYIWGERNLIQGNTISGADHGIYVYRSDDGRIVDNTIAGNDVGILFDRSSDRVTNNTIADNRVGVEVITEDGDEHIRVAFERNLLANNTEFGVKNSVPSEFVFDARNNSWGAADGPSSAPANDSDAPFADPVTGTLANGSGDAVSEGNTPGVSNVRFDPFLTAPSNDSTSIHAEMSVESVGGVAVRSIGIPVLPWRKRINRPWSL